MQERVAIVTGAGAGIGRGIARRLAREGATVVVAEYNRETGTQTAGELEGLGGKGIFIETDITRLETVEAMVAQTLSQFGRVDILVNNAYPTSDFPSPIEDMPAERYARAMTAGFDAVVTAMRAAFPSMRERGWGRIINICSLNGVNAHRYTSDYNSAKEAVRAFTRTAAVEWARHGITANIICPAAITTPYKTFAEMMPEMAETMLKQNPMGRMGDPEEDIGPVAVFLASEASRYMTGNTLFVDGGGHINGVSWMGD